MLVKFLQQVGCIFVVSLAVKVLVAYVLLPHYILVMEAADCANWIRKVVLEERKVDRSKHTPNFCIQQQLSLAYCTIHNTKGSPLTPDGCASPHCCLLHLGNDAIESVIVPIVMPTVTMI